MTPPTKLEKQNKRIADTERKIKEAEAERVAGIPEKRRRASEIYAKRDGVKPKKTTTKTKKTNAPTLKRGAGKYKVPVIYRTGISLSESTELKNAAYDRKFTQDQFERLVKSYDEAKLMARRMA